MARTDWYPAYAEYQKLRCKYPTDDVRQWSKEDQKRAEELKELTYDVTEDDIYAVIEMFRREKEKGFKGKLRKMFRWFNKLRWGLELF